MANALPKTLKTRIGNGAVLFMPIDGRPVDQRSIAARRFREIYIAVCEDIGGVEILSELQVQFARRCASLAVFCEEQEALLVEHGHKAVDMERYLLACGTFGRLAAKLGLRRRPRDITPTLDEYVASKAGGQGNGKFK